MTLCIGALADGSTDNPKIVISADMLLGNDYYNIKTSVKYDVGFTDTLTALYSGAWEDCENLKRVLLRWVRVNPLTLDTYKVTLTNAWREFDSIATGSEPSQSEAQCIIAGFIENEPRIIRVQKAGVEALPFFACIGIGGYHADTILSWRNIQQYSSLEQVLYYLHEARRFGEMCSSVGGTSIMHVLNLDEAGVLNVSIIMGHGLSIMDGWFKKYGPQPVGYDLELDSKSFSRITPDP